MAELYQAGDSLARVLRRAAQNEEESRAVARLADFNGTEQDLTLAIDMCRRVGDLSTASVLSDMLPTKPSPGP